MKLNQIFLIVLITLILQLSARHVQNQTLLAKNKEKQNNKGILDRIFGDWNKASITVHGLQQFEFDCNILDAFLDKDFKQPLGIAFDGFNQITRSDRSGFMTHAVGIHRVEGQVTEKPILDFRFIQNCLFTDNESDWWSIDWVLYFTVVPNEEYYQQYSRSRGNQWKVDMRLPSLGKSETKDLKNKLRGLCQERNKQMNKLKDNAVKSGQSVNSGLQLYKSRLVSLKDQSKLGSQKSTLIETVRTEQTEIQVQYKLQIEKSEKSLKQQMDKLHKSSISSQCTESEIDVFYKQVKEIKEQLSELDTNQAIIKTNIDQSKSDLSEALELQEQKEETIESLAKKKYEQVEQNKEDKIEFDRLFTETQAKLLKMQEDYAIKKQQQENKISLINSQQEQTTEEKKKLNLNIEQLQQQIEAQTDQVKSIDDQTKVTQQQLELIQDKLNEKITISNKFEIEQKLTEENIKQQKIKLTIIRTESTRKIQILKKREIEQINLLKNKDESKKKQLIEDAEKAEQELQNYRSKFEQDLENIENVARATYVQTKKALQNVESGQYVNDINSIVSNANDQMRMSQMRFLKQEKQREQIVKYRFQQMHQVRLMRNKLKSKIQKKLLR